MLVDLAETEEEARAQAIIDFGITQSFVGQDSPYVKLIERYGRYIRRKDAEPMDQVVLWRSRPVRITNKYSIPIWGRRVDTSGRPSRDRFVIDIYITDNDLRSKQIVIGHRQMRSTGVGTSQQEALVYFLEEINPDYGMYGKIIALPWCAPVFIRDLIQPKWIVFEYI